jgi:hypothetical protein
VAAAYVREAVARVVLLTDGLPSGRHPRRREAGAPSPSSRPHAACPPPPWASARPSTTTSSARSRGAASGGFYYLATPESIPAAFGRELAGVFAIAATRVELKIVLEDRVSSCEVLHRVPTRAAPDGLMIEIGEIAHGSPRQVLVRLMRAASPDFGDGDVPSGLLAKAAVTYRDAAGREAAHLARIASGSARRARSWPRSLSNGCAWPAPPPSTRPGPGAPAVTGIRQSPHSPRSVRPSPAPAIATSPRAPSSTRCRPRSS